ncbi:MAG: hypothetical protein WDZ40_04435 [Candidatus Spechtbacterales bacterium]
MNTHIKIGLGLILGFILLIALFYLNLKLASKIENKNNPQNESGLYEETQVRFF